MGLRNVRWWNIQKLWVPSSTNRDLNTFWCVHQSNIRAGTVVWCVKACRPPARSVRTYYNLSHLQNNQVYDTEDNARDRHNLAGLGQN